MTSSNPGDHTYSDECVRELRRLLAALNRRHHHLELPLHDPVLRWALERTTDGSRPDDFDSANESHQAHVKRAGNLLVRILRPSRARHPEQLPRPHLVPAPKAPPPGESLLDALHAVLPQIPPHFRDPLERHVLQGHSYKQISDDLEVPVGTVKSRIHRARSMLERLLRPWP